MEKIDTYRMRFEEIQRIYKKNKNDDHIMKLRRAIGELHKLYIMVLEYKPEFRMYSRQELDFDNYKKVLLFKIHDYDVELKSMYHKVEKLMLNY